MLWHSISISAVRIRGQLYLTHAANFVADMLAKEGL